MATPQYEDLDATGLINPRFRDGTTRTKCVQFDLSAMSAATLFTVSFNNGGMRYSYIQAGRVDTDETTTSATYADLATVGPSVTLTTGTSVLCFIAAGVYHPTVQTGARIGVDISGATTIAPSVNQAVDDVGVANITTFIGRFFKITGLNAGVNTFKLKYITTVATASTHFTNRDIVIIPL